MNRFWFSVILFCAISAYSGLSSIPIQFLLCCCATSAVVPAPRNGSRTVPFGGHPARMQGSTSSVGYVAKCAPLYGLVLIVQTDLRFFIAPTVYPVEDEFASVPRRESRRAPRLSPAQMAGSLMASAS